MRIVQWIVIWSSFWTIVSGEKQIKLFITTNEKQVLQPKQYLQQTAQTIYTIEGQGLQQMKALQLMMTYKLNKGIKMLDVWVNNDDVGYTLMLGNKNTLSFGKISHNEITEWESQKIQEYDMGQPFKVELVSQNKGMVYLKRGVLMMEAEQKQGRSIIKFIELRRHMDNDLHQCTATPPFIICISNNQLVQLTETSTNIKMQGVYSLANHSCIVGSRLIDENVVALCDCQDGCFNYAIINGQVQELAALRMSGVMNMGLVEGGYLGATMSVLMGEKVVYYRWSPVSIVYVDQHMVPNITNATVTRHQSALNMLVLSYERQGETLNVIVQHSSPPIPLNTILNCTSICVFQSELFCFKDNKSQLQIRHVNPYYLLINSSQMLRDILVHVTSPQQVLILRVLPVFLGEIVMDDELQDEFQIEYNAEWSISVSQLYKGKRNHEYNVGMGCCNISTVSIYKQEKILSIYNRLKCMGMWRQNGWTFVRMMQAPNNNVYYQDCSYLEQIGNYYCQLTKIYHYSTGQLLHYHPQYEVWRRDDSLHIVGMDYNLTFQVEGKIAYHHPYIVYQQQKHITVHDISTNNTIQLPKLYPIVDMSLHSNTLLVGYAHQSSMLACTYNNFLHKHCIQVDEGTYLRQYQQYLLIINSTHITKYSKIMGDMMFCYEYSEERAHIKEVIMNSQYLLLVMQHGYRLFDCLGQMFAFEVEGQHGKDVCGMVQLMNEELLIGTNDELLIYSLELVVDVGELEYSPEVLSKKVEFMVQPRGMKYLQQNTTILVGFENTELYVQGHKPKKLHLPYSTSNGSIAIEENMFYGPIRDYQISDTFNSKIMLVPHLQPIGCGLPTPLCMSLLQYNYTTMHQSPTTNNNNTYGFTNSTHTIIVTNSKIVNELSYSNESFGCYEYKRIGEDELLVVCERGFYWLKGKEVEYIDMECEVKRESLLVRDHGQLWIVGMSEDGVVLAVNRTSHKVENTSLREVLFIGGNEQHLVVGTDENLCIGGWDDIWGNDLIACTPYKHFIPSYFVLPGFSFTGVHVFNTNNTCLHMLLLSQDSLSFHFHLEVSIKAKISFTIIRVYRTIPTYDLHSVVGLQPQSDGYLLLGLKRNQEYTLSFYKNSLRENQPNDWPIDVRSAVNVESNVQMCLVGDNVLIGNDWYRVHSQLSLVLDYDVPPPAHYLTFHGSNSIMSLPFYSKLLFESPPDNSWLYCLLCFTGVILLLLVLRILRALVDCGVIRWGSTSSSDDISSLDEEGFQTSSLLESSP